MLGRYVNKNEWMNEWIQKYIEIHIALSKLVNQPSNIMNINHIKQ